MASKRRGHYRGYLVSPGCGNLLVRMEEMYWQLKRWRVSGNGGKRRMDWMGLIYYVQGRTQARWSMRMSLMAERSRRAGGGRGRRSLRRYWRGIYYYMMLQHSVSVCLPGMGLEVNSLVFIGKDRGILSQGWELRYVESSSWARMSWRRASSRATSIWRSVDGDSISIVRVNPNNLGMFKGEVYI